MTGFYCATPYHVFVALHLSLTKYKDVKKNLLIVNHFPSAVGLAERIRKTGIYENVFVLTYGKRTLRQKMDRLVKSFFADKVVKEFISFPYEEIIFFALDFINYAYITKHKKNTVFAYGEDGIGTYFRNDIYEPSGLAEFLIQVQGKKKYLSEIKKIYVFKKDMVYKDCPFDIQEMDRIDINNSEFRDIIKQIWTNKTVLGNCDAIYIEQPYEEVFGADYVPFEAGILEEISSFFEKDKLVLRMHPRSREKFADKKKDMGGAPFEIELLDFNIEQKVIISTFSTACLSPKMIYDKEPVIILTYKLCPMFLEQYKEIDNVENLIKLLEEQYRDKSRVIIPESLDELRSTLEVIRWKKYGMS